MVLVTDLCQQGNHLLRFTRRDLQSQNQLLDLERKRLQVFKVECLW